MKKNILLTGLPRSGKTTLLESVVEHYPSRVGFVTREVRSDGERIGFDIITHTGRSSVLARVGYESPFKVSRYAVAVEELENVLPLVSSFGPLDLLYLDEIGQMELFSEKFKQLAKKYLDAPNPLLATISQVYSDSFIQEVKQRSDVLLVPITEVNRDEQRVYVSKFIEKLMNDTR